MRQHSIVIDADASPSGYVVWYNHFTGARNIRTIRPAIKNERFGVQRMEMLAIYFALADNLKDIRKMVSKRKKSRVIVAVRSDSKSTVEQLLGLSQIRDGLMRRISAVIVKLLSRVKYRITFDHLDRSRNIAGLLIEQLKRKETERAMRRLAAYAAPLS